MVKKATKTARKTAAKTTRSVKADKPKAGKVGRPRKTLKAPVVRRPRKVKSVAAAPVVQKVSVMESPEHVFEQCQRAINRLRERYTDPDNLRTLQLCCQEITAGLDALRIAENSAKELIRLMQQIDHSKEPLSVPKLVPTTPVAHEQPLGSQIAATVTTNSEEPSDAR